MKLTSPAWKHTSERHSIELQHVCLLWKKKLTLNGDVTSADARRDMGREAFSILSGSMNAALPKCLPGIVLSSKRCRQASPS